MNSLIRRRSGASLPEVLIVMGILAILSSLLLPAIQDAREAARRLQCQTNLKQIGVALHGYAETFGMFPNYYPFNRNERPWNGAPRSIHVALLPWLEPALYDQMNFHVILHWAPPDNEPPHPALGTAFYTKVSGFLCPSDQSPSFGRRGVNYRVNSGVGPKVFRTIEAPDSGNGFIGMMAPIRPRDITDGLTHTAAFSERLRGSDSPETPSQARDFGLSLTQKVTRSADLALAICTALAADDPKPDYVIGGRNWLHSIHPMTHYTHAQEPNGAVPDCIHRSTFWEGIPTARSLHSGGVNLLLADGSIRFSANQTERRVWRAIGSRADSELFEW